MKTIFKISTFLYCVLFYVKVNAQELTKEDYERAKSFMFNNYNNKTAFNLYTTANWFKDNSGVWFIDYNLKGKTYKTVSFKNKKVTTLFNHNKLAQELSKIVDETISPLNLSLSNVERTKDGNLEFKFKNNFYTFNVEKNNLETKEEEKKEEENSFESTSPDGNWIAFSKNYNLFIKSTNDDKEYQLSFDGDKNYEYASYYGWYDIMEGENGERPKRFFVDWSKDSKYIATSVVDSRNAEKMYLLDYSIDSLYKPKLLAYYRGSPGDTTMVHIKPVFFNIETKKEISTKLPTNTHINSVSVRFSEKSGILFANYAERGFQTEYVKKIDLNNQKEETLITETSETNIDNFEFRVLDKQEKIVFLSERSGWRQLYSVDLKTKETKAITKGEYYINSLEFIDQERGVIYFLASGKETSNNPYHQQVYKVDFKKGKTTLLTPENLHHSVSFSKNGDYFVDNISSINAPTRTVLRASKTGKILAELTSANVDHAISKGWETPEVFSLIAKDKKTTIYGAIWKPTNFDSSKKYPIIDHTYTGPHTQMFPKTFDRGFMNQSLAELGFIVMMVDGLGTSGRSKAFHNHSYKNMGSNLEDHILAIKHLAKKYNWIDINKVGIFGHSAGGFDTGRAMLAYPDFYKVGVASSADHDFRMEKAWWPEMYQGWPVDSTYQSVSNITNAKNLKGKLLLVHGGLDDNVNPSATFKLAEELIKNDKEFDLLIIPSQRHGYVGDYRSYFIKKRWNYFIEHLGGRTPIWNIKL
ncbi:DPP IV N-terminal domain-containing protein [uncultured Lutibacter sp.]|uniref:S9 family peptidase n=1 Tax=uncultured Lutibacter sp. TaxID=437739 RepID=UPI0026074D05|nr:DPP IV N-terminal domain-containing protein [uncultured Lutibacter sp.]